MKRKYPVSFFIMGVLQNLARYVLIGLLGAVLLLIGQFGFESLRVIGTVILIGYLLLCIIEQFFIRAVSLRESDNPQVNEILDQVFGIDNQNESSQSPHQRIIDQVNEIINSRRANNNDQDSDF